MTPCFSPFFSAEKEQNKTKLQEADHYTPIFHSSIFLSLTLEALLPLAAFALITWLRSAVPQMDAW